MHEYTVIVTFVRSTSASYVKVITFLMDMLNIKKFFSKNEDQPLFIRNVKDIHTKSVNFNALIVTTPLFSLLVWHQKHMLGIGL